MDTGQHYDYELSQAFIDELEIPLPDYNLGVGSGSHATQIGRMLTRIEKVLLREYPDLVLVYGDTNSTLGGALVASRLKIPIGHIEAGPRLHDMRIPEEANRIFTDHLSRLLFCPTGLSVTNLKNEGIINGVYLTGDVIYDEVLRSSKIAEKIRYPKYPRFAKT
ncbi:UDP-N-acetyl glucosamine 2-epimerase [Chloroflexota bacterium]